MTGHKEVLKEPIHYGRKFWFVHLTPNFYI